jgi:hypothetical protein
MNGYASFNQVFFTDVNFEPDLLVSEVGNGCRLYYGSNCFPATSGTITLPTL